MKNQEKPSTTIVQTKRVLQEATTHLDSKAVQREKVKSYTFCFSERNGRRDSKGKIKDLCLGRIALGELNLII